MASTASIPKFLLPQNRSLARGSHHRVFSLTNPLRRPLPLAFSRPASTSKPIPKPIPKTLAKPEKFNPPSHPSRLVKSAPIRQYGPALTEEEKTIHQTKQYPHMPPPKGSLMDRFLNNRQIHMFITLGVLFFFACWTLVLDFKATSPFAGTMPEWSDWFRHPLDSLARFGNVVKLHTLHESEVTAEKRARALTETMKTKAYRVMHGLEPLEGQPTEVQILVARMRGTYIESTPGESGQVEPTAPPPQAKKPIKKWLGIW